MNPCTAAYDQFSPAGAPLEHETRAIPAAWEPTHLLHLSQVPPSPLLGPALSQQVTHPFVLVEPCICSLLSHSHTPVPSWGGATCFSKCTVCCPPPASLCTHTHKPLLRPVSSLSGWLLMDLLTSLLSVLLSTASQWSEWHSRPASRAEAVHPCWPPLGHKQQCRPSKPTPVAARFVPRLYPHGKGSALVAPGMSVGPCTMGGLRGSGDGKFAGFGNARLSISLVISSYSCCLLPSLRPPAASGSDLGDILQCRDHLLKGNAQPSVTLQLQPCARWVENNAKTKQPSKQ